METLTSANDPPGVHVTSAQKFSNGVMVPSDVHVFHISTKNKENENGPKLLASARTSGLAKPPRVGPHDGEGITMFRIGAELQLGTFDWRGPPCEKKWDRSIAKEAGLSRKADN